MTPVSLMRIQSVAATTRIIRIMRSTARVGGQLASTADFAAARAASLISWLLTCGRAYLVIKFGDDVADGLLFCWRNRSKLDTKRVRGRMMHHFAMQG